MAWLADNYAVPRLRLSETVVLARAVRRRNIRGINAMRFDTWSFCVTVVELRSHRRELKFCTGKPLTV